MDIESLDRRIIKTKKLLISTMLDLLQKKSLVKITVSEICDIAMVSRATFYLHYKDKYDLLEECLSELERRIVNSADETEICSNPHDMTRAIQDNPKLFRNIFLYEQSEELQKLFFEHCYQNFMQFLIQKQKDGYILNSIPEAMAAFYAGGVSSLLNWWITNDFPISADEINRCQETFLFL